MLETVLRWFIFSVCVGLLPVIYTTLGLYTRGAPAALDQILGKGELLLICVALDADALGEIIVSAKVSPIIKVILGGSCFLIISLATFWYSDISNLFNSGTRYQQRPVAIISIILLIISLLACGFCKALA